MNTEIIKIQPGDGPVSEEDDAKLKAAGEILRREVWWHFLRRQYTVWAEMH